MDMLPSSMASAMPSTSTSMSPDTTMRSRPALAFLNVMLLSLVSRASPVSRNDTHSQRVIIRTSAFLLHDALDRIGGWQLHSLASAIREFSSVLLALLVGRARRLAQVADTMRHLMSASLGISLVDDGIGHGFFGATFVGGSVDDQTSLEICAVDPQTALAIPRAFNNIVAMWPLPVCPTT